MPTFPRWCFQLIRVAVLLAALPLPAQQPLPATSRQIPEPLRPWQDWALWDDIHRHCPSPFDDADKHLCFWPGRLSLKADASGGWFGFDAMIFSEAWVPLPGGTESWPVEVKLGGQPAPVVDRNGGPAIRVPPGTHRIEGGWKWNAIPQRLALPPQIGLLALAIDGMPVEFPRRDAGNLLWLKRDAISGEADRDAISVKVYSAIEDGIPMWFRSEIELVVSGKSREESIGSVLPAGWKLASVQSGIPVAVDGAGHLKAQVRAGRWNVRLDSFRVDNAAEIRFAEEAKPAATEQLIAFQSQPELRRVEVTGLPSVDVAQTTMPQHWRALPVYRWDTSGPFRIEERMRGSGSQKPGGLSIEREWWLDETGRAYTFRDRIRGGMQQVWRLDVLSGQDLGSVRERGVGQLLTRNRETGEAGVEVRSRDLDLEATGRMARSARPSASGWNVDVDQLRVNLELPPGWRLFALMGADWVHGDWLTSWTLLDLFLLLLFSLAVLRLWGFLPALLAFVAFGLSYHEPGAARYAWLLLLPPLALLRVVPAGWGRRLLFAWKWGVVLFLVWIVAPFIQCQVQNALYPQLESVRREPVMETFVAGAAEASDRGTDDAAVASMEAKLNRIIIPEISFRDTPVREAIDFLKKKASELDAESDPGSSGFSIVLKLDGLTAAESFGMGPGLEAPETRPGISPAEARITLQLSNIPLREALKYVASLSGLKVKVEPYAVALVPLSEPTDVMVTKEYSVSPNFVPSSDGSSVGSARASTREFLEASGVTFPPGASADYSAASSKLIVRNTRENLDLIDARIDSDSSSFPGYNGIDAIPSRVAKRTRDVEAHIQTGPGVPDWTWRQVSFGWNGPVVAAHRVRPILISRGLEAALSILRVMSILALAGVLLGARRPRDASLGPRSSGVKGAAVLLLVAGFLVPGIVGAEIPDKPMLDTLRKRLLQPSEPAPVAADIPSLTLSIRDRTVSLDAEIHATTRTAVPLPGRLPGWSPLSVEVDGKPETAVLQRDGYLWVILAEGVHRVRVAGLLPDAADWEWTFPLKPRRVTIDAPDWNVSGVRTDGSPESQVLFARKQKQQAGEATYDRQAYEAVAAVERRIELGLVWRVTTIVQRLSPAGKAVSLRIPLLPGERVLTPDITVKDGAVEVQIGARQGRLDWESELTASDSLRLETRAGDSWVERWRLVAAPIWNVEIRGLKPTFEAGRSDLEPVWRPWPGEHAELGISRPEAIAGATTTVMNAAHSETLGKRQRLGTLDLNVRTSLGGDFIIGLPPATEVTGLRVDDKEIPARMEGGRLIVPVRPGDPKIQVSWKSTETLGVRARMAELRLPVPGTNINSSITLPDNRWVLWEDGPQRGPAVQFWAVLLGALIGAGVLGRLQLSPLRAWEWMLLTVGLTQVPLPAALVVVGWFFLLVWRGSDAFPRPAPWRWNFIQLVLVGLTVGAISVLVGAVAKGLLGNPEMFIRGNGSGQSLLKWYLDRSAETLPRPGCVTVSIWWYRFLMLIWALWLAAALIRWLGWAWNQFSRGGCFHRMWQRKASAPKVPVPPLPPAP